MIEVLWDIGKWLSFIFMLGFFIACVCDVGGLIGRFLTPTPTSVDESVKLMYVDQRRDPTAPDVYEWAGARNADQKRSR